MRKDIEILREQVDLLTKECKKIINYFNLGILEEEDLLLLKSEINYLNNFVYNSLKGEKEK